MIDTRPTSSPCHDPLTPSLPRRLRRIQGHASRPRLFRVLGLGRRMLAAIPLPVLLVTALAGAVLLAASRIPIRERLRAEARVVSRLSAAPVLMVGDSIAYRAAPTALCGDSVLNAAIPGDRVGDLVADARAYGGHVRADRVVIAVGVNDAWQAHRDIEAWTAAYRRMVALYGDRDLVLVEINPPDLRTLSVKMRIDLDFIAEANAAIRAIAAQSGARLVPAPRRVETRDGLHPTPTGIQRWRARLALAACT